MVDFSRSNVLAQIWNNEHSTKEIIPILMILVDERNESFLHALSQILILTNSLFALMNVEMRKSLE